jgi:hypothetical protein
MSRYLDTVGTDNAIRRIIKEPATLESILEDDLVALSLLISAHFQERYPANDNKEPEDFS